MLPPSLPRVRGGGERAELVAAAPDLMRLVALLTVFPSSFTVTNGKGGKVSGVIGSFCVQP